MELPFAKDLDFTENWINSIDQEVLRGAKIRNEKSKSNKSNSFYQYDPVNIDFNKPSCSKSHESKLQGLRSRKNVKSKRSVSPQKRKRYKKIKNKYNGRNTCGMRIAELAVPSKRHCMETWRSKWETLPTLMVDRLRKIVMDQKPIVPIQDAIICFKQNKTNIARSLHKGKRTRKSKKTKEIRILCGIFGFRISSQLQAPRNVTLGSRLIPISHVVNDEISRLLVKRKTSKLQKNIQLEIANKITNWIADIMEQSTYDTMLDDYMELEKEEGHIWDIIDDLVDNVALLCKDTSSSSSDVIEAESSDSNPSFINEDNEVYSESEHSDDNNLAEFENIISNIVEQITSEDNKTKDIDAIPPEDLNDMEEYSPKTSPESIDNYINKFLSNHIDEITFNDEEAFEDAIHFDNSDSELFDKTPNHENQDIQNIIENNNDEQINDINNEANINNDINEVIDIDDNSLTNEIFHEAVKESSVDNNSIDITKHDYSPENISKKVSATLSDKNEAMDVMKSLPQDNEDAIDVIINNGTNSDNKIEESNLEIDETMPLTHITSDDSDKKVKFSNINSGRGQLNIKSNIRDGENIKPGTQGIHFAPPNNNLLSDVDESWPENLRFPIVKATISISKSILSLGKITEDDENNKDNDSLNEDTKDKYVEDDGEIEKNTDSKITSLKNNHSNVHIDKKLTNNDSNPVVDDVIDTDNVNLNREEVQPLIDNNIKSSKHVVDKNRSDNYDHSKSVIEDILKTNIPDKSEENLQKIISEILLENIQSHVQVVDKNLIDSTNSQAPQDGDGGPADTINKAIEPFNMKNKRGPVKLSVEHLPVIFIYPEIYTANIQCPEKAFQETTRINSIGKCQYMESEVRIWCHGLQNVIQNLDMWLDWIDNTCSNLLHLKQKEKFPPCKRKIQYNNRKWITLKTNIDSDAKLWKKLRTGLQVGLLSYKYFYQTPERYYLTEQNGE